MSYIGNQPTTVAFVTDQFNGDGTTTVFTMSVAPANTASVLVTVSGVLQNPSTYSVSGTTLTFSAAPPTGTGSISVRYLGIPASGVTTTAYRTITEFTATAGQTTFSVPSYTVGYIDVYRNGVRLGTADFTASNGTTIVLGNGGASAGDLVTTESFYVSSVSNAIPAVAGAVNTSYIADGSITQAKLATGVCSTAPAFSAYGNSIQSTTSGVITKMQINTEEFDTANCFDNSTNYRFTPNVAGYYQVNGAIGYANQSAFTLVYIYKNGSEFKRGTQTYSTASLNRYSVTALVYLNGSTDYIELYGLQNSGGSLNTDATQQTLYFQAFLARAA